MNYVYLAALGTAFVGFIVLHWYMTRCENCGSWLNFEDKHVHFDEHQQCYFEHPFYKCRRCGHKKWLAEVRRTKEFYARKSL